MMAATEETRNQLRHSDETTTTKALIQKPRKYWHGNSFLQAVNVCDKFFNCAYVKFQLEEELMEETRKKQHMRNVSIEHLWSKMDNGVEVEVYRQFLFEENGLEPFEDHSYHHHHSKPDHRDGPVERLRDQEARTLQQE